MVARRRPAKTKKRKRKAAEAAEEKKKKTALAKERQRLEKEEAQDKKDKAESDQMRSVEMGKAERNATKLLQKDQAASLLAASKVLALLQPVHSTMTVYLKDAATGGPNRKLADIPEPIVAASNSAYQQLDAVYQNCLQRIANPLASLTCGPSDAKTIKTRADAALKELRVFASALTAQ